MLPIEESSNLAAKDSLTQPIGSTEIALPIRLAIVNSIFQIDLTIGDFLSRDGGLQAWFTDWFEEQCEAAAYQISAKTHQELLQILSYIQETCCTTSRDKVAQQLCTTSSPTRTALDLEHGDAKLNASLTLAARLWLSTSVDSLQHFFTPGYVLRWSGDQCLQDAFDDEFSSIPQSIMMVKLPRVFTAANLEKIAGIHVQYTNSLADHLVLRDDDKKVMFFHHASFLELSKESNKTLLKNDLIDETLRTMALLIPSNDSNSRKWFKKRRKGLALDSGAGSFPALNASARQIDGFHYWRDRLIILKQAFDDSEPNTISSWWYDDRKKVQWYTFWVAALVLLLTVVFGLIQSVSGVVQAWAAVKTLRLK